MAALTAHLITIHLILVLIYTVQSQSYRLPSTVFPLSYNLTLFPHLNNSDISAFTYDGWVTIEINISQKHLSSNLSSLFNIQLNKGIDLTINQSDISLDFPSLNENSGFVTFSSLDFNNITEIVTIYFNTTNNEILTRMNESSYIIGYLYCSFSSPLKSNAQRGFYLSSYDYNNITIHGTGTQMEPTYTRRALPCFDEPQWRAIFYVTYIAPIDSITLGNMDIDQVINFADTTQYQCDYVSSKGTNNLCKMVRFLPTPPMPAYLLAFVIGDYDHLENIQINKQLTPPIGGFINFTHSVWFRLSTSEYFDFALNNSVTILSWFENAFNLTYNLNKLDSVALVQYGGAMENWGLCIYGPNAILIDPNVQQSEGNLRSKIGLIGHELAHQWFGNDVTLEWWDQLWVQEGFARYFEYIVGNETRPDLPFHETFYWWVWEGAFRNSESIYTFAAERENIETQSEILSQFNQALTYSKGACIAKFMRQYVGDDLFYKALNEYLMTYYYGVANSNQLFAIFDGYVDIIDNEYNDEPMLATKMFGSYVKQAGFPILYVNFDEIGDDSILVTVSQQRMVLEGPQFYSDTNNDNPYYDPILAQQFAEQLWYIPYRIEQSDGEILMDFPTNTSHRTFEIKRVETDGYEYYLFNPNADFFFRVAYDEKSMNLIINSFESLSYLSQYSILSDQWRLMRSNYVTTALYLQLIQQIATPTIITKEYWGFFWGTITDSLIEIDNLLCEYDIISPTNQTLIEYRNNYHIFVRQTLDELWMDVGGDWYIDEENMDSETINLKKKLLSMFIQMNDKDIIETGLHILLASNYQNLTAFDGQIPDIDSNILQQVFQAAFASLNETVYDIIINKIFPESNNNQQNAILNSIGLLYGNKTILQNAYDFINDDISDTGQKNTGYRNLRQCSGRGLIWDNMMSRNATDWLNYYSFNEGSAKSFPEVFASLDRYKQVYDFYVEQNILNDITTDTNQTLERMYMNSQWLLSNEYTLIKFLDEYVNPDQDDEEEQDNWLSVVIYSIMAVVVLMVIIAVFYWMIRKKRQNAIASMKYDEMNETEQQVEANKYGSTAT